MGTYASHMKAGSHFKEPGPRVQHPRGEQRPLQSPPPLPSSPEAEAEAASEERGHLPLSIWPAAGRGLGFRQKRRRRRRTRQSQQRKVALAAKAGGSSTRPDKSPNKAHRGLEGRRDTRGSLTQLLPTAWGLDRWSRAPPSREKRMGFRRANLNSSAKATGTGTRAGRAPGNERRALRGEGSAGPAAGRRTPRGARVPPDAGSPGRGGRDARGALPAAPRGPPRRRAARPLALGGHTKGPARRAGRRAMGGLDPGELPARGSRRAPAFVRRAPRRGAPPPAAPAPRSLPG